MASLFFEAPLPSSNGLLSRSRAPPASERYVRGGIWRMMEEQIERGPARRARLDPCRAQDDPVGGLRTLHGTAAGFWLLLLESNPAPPLHSPTTRPIHTSPPPSVQTSERGQATHDTMKTWDALHRGILLGMYVRVDAGLAACVNVYRSNPSISHHPICPCTYVLCRGGLTLIATYRSVEEYKKRAAIQERREAAKAAAWAKKAAVEAEAEAAARAAAPATLAKAK